MPHDHREPNKANQIVFVFHAEQTRFTEVIVSAKRGKGSDNNKDVLLTVGRFITSDDDLSPGAQDRRRLPKEMRGVRFEVEVQKTGRGYFVVDGDGRIR